MAVRVENSGAINFGTFASAAVVTHARAQFGTAILTTRALTTQRTIAAGEQGEFANGDLDLVFPANQLENAGLNALLSLALDGTNALTIKLMTSANVEVSVGGYSDQDVTGWNLTNESD